MATATIMLPFQQGDGLAQATRHITAALKEREGFAVMLVRLKDVERICASIGHQRTADLVDDFHAELVRLCRRGDTVERIGDRKFALLLHNLKNRGHITLAARKIERMARGLRASDGSIPKLETITGVVLTPDQSDEPHEILRLAEVASLNAGRNGDSPCFFEAQSARQLYEEWGLESRLTSALESGILELHFQPKTLIQRNNIVSAEALLRWHDADLGPISPEVFVEMAESTGQIVELTEFVILTACRILSEWQVELPDLHVAVNITPSMLKNRDILGPLKSATRIWGISPERLTLEITETALMDNRKASHDVLMAIRKFGCRVSIDDFGTGYSSLAYLKEIPADELKIDRTFIMGMLNDYKDRKIVEYAIGIAKSFGLSVVAEGIEDAATLQALRELECDYAQGYYISKPLPADEFVKFCGEFKG